MILLDTNVISEPLKSAGDPRVAAWIDAQVLDTLYLSTVTVAELRYGIAALPDGRKKRALRHQIETRMLPLFESRILSFDLEAAEACAMVRMRARAAGKSKGTADSYIAAIAAAKGFAVATREAGPFLAAGVQVINPWEQGVRERLDALYGTDPELSALEPDIARMQLASLSDEGW